MSTKTVKKSTPEEEKILSLARTRFSTAAQAESDNREASTEDINFVYNTGEHGQWPADIRAERQQAKRPCITVNKLVKFVKQLQGEQQQNRVSMKARPVDVDADVATAEVYSDILRHIESISSADTAYDTAYQQAVAGGWGWWRIVTDFFDDESFDQDILIKRIFNPYTVYFDPHAQEFDLSDARFFLITEKLSKEEFEGAYPGQPLADFDTGSKGEEFEKWFFEDQVRIAEYFYKEMVDKKLVQVILKEVPEAEVEVKEITEEITEEALIKIGYEILNRKTVKSSKIMWCKMTGNSFLEKPRRWPGKYFPIVRVVGDEVNIQGKRVVRSLIRDAKDPQRTYNYQITSATETVALVPKSPFIATAEQLEGYTQMWKEANTKNLPYLLYKNQQGVAPPQRQPQAQVPSGAITLAQIGANDIMDTTGRFESSLGQPSNERSGVAIQERQAASNTITFSFINNFMKALFYSARVIIDLIPRIYDTDRVIRLTGEDDVDKLIAINRAIPGQDSLLHDLSKGKYDVKPAVGVMHGTKRAEIADSMIRFMQFVPNAAPLVMDLVAKNQDWPGKEEFVKRLEALLPPEVRNPEGQNPQQVTE